MTRRGSFLVSGDAGLGESILVDDRAFERFSVTSAVDRSGSAFSCSSLLEDELLMVNCKSRGLFRVSGQTIQWRFRIVFPCFHNLSGQMT